MLIQIGSRYAEALHYYMIGFLPQLKWERMEACPFDKTLELQAETSEGVPLQGDLLKLRLTAFASISDEQFILIFCF